jgi:hypothetical protein
LKRASAALLALIAVARAKASVGADVPGRSPSVSRRRRRAVLEPEKKRDLVR